MDKKFIDSKLLDNYEILTNDGFKDVIALHKTIEYQIFKLITDDFELHCADNHIVFLENNDEIFVKNLQVGQKIKTMNGIQEIINIEETHYSDNMYDFELSGDNVTYYTNGILSHNTSYVRYLISILSKTKKKVIYIPAYMIEQMANPEFITFLQKNKESILILEDAEFALQSRAEEYGAQAVSNLLNITNGLLNDATKIQVIATFNMDKKKLDEALLRPGRLLNEWKFSKLSIEDAKALVEHLGKELDITEPMTVAEIYEGKVQSNKKKKKQIGF